MDSNDYKVDVAALNQQKENLAVESYDKIVKNAAVSNNITFLKKTYDFQTIKERKTETNILTVLSVLWTRISILGGFKNEMAFEITQDITNLIFGVYSDLTIEEIYKAFELERFGLYEEKTKHFQLFNSEYVSEILKKYKKWKHEMKMQHNITNQKNIPQLPASTEAEKKNIRFGFIKMVWDEIQEKKEPISWSLYNDLRSEINASKQKEDDLYNLELARYQVELGLKKTSDFQSINAYKDLLRQIENKNQVNLVVNRCKSKLVNEYIKSNFENIDELLKLFGYE